MDREKINIAIVGSGLTGLTTAYYLKKAGINFRIFEKNANAGGVMQTHHEGGFTFESGPNTGVLSRLEVVNLLEELKGDCSIEIADEAAKSRWIWKGDRWFPLPSGLLSGILTPLFSLRDKFRLLGEPFRKKGTNPNETLAQLVLRRMGNSFLDYAIDPFIIGIYSGDPSKLITKYAFPKLYNLEQNYGSFIGGAIKKGREKKSVQQNMVTKDIFSVKGGLSNLINALKKRIGSENIAYNSKNLSFTSREGKYYDNFIGECFTHVVSTTGGYALNNLFPFLGIRKLQPITDMHYSKVIQVSVGFNKWKWGALNAFGGLVPFKEQRRILGVLFLSSFLKDKAPEGGALLSVFIGGVRRPELTELNDNEIFNLVKDELCDMLNMDSFSPDLFKVFRYSHAIPQYGAGSEERLEAIDNLEKEYKGLVLAGNIRDGIGIADRIKQGTDVSSQIINQIK